MKPDVEDRAAASRALWLVSGGLDSELAGRLATLRGLRLEGVHFRTGFNLDSRSLRVSDGCPGVETDVIDVGDDYFDAVVRPASTEPAHVGFCRRCRLFLLERAASVARERGIDLLVTGDVVGQRTHGLSRAQILETDRQVGIEGKVFRPLSEALLPPVAGVPARRPGTGFDGKIHGRSRRRQFGLARRLGVVGYAIPSGRCCRLEDDRFVALLRDLCGHSAVGPPSDGDLELLGVGRHFRVSFRAKVVLGRNEEESRRIESLGSAGLCCQVADGRGSLGIVVGEPDDGDLRRIASLAARFSAARADPQVTVRFLGRDGETRIEVLPAKTAEVESWRL